MANLRFGVLGPLELWRDGAPVQVPSGRRRAVLCCLLANLGRPVSADKLVEAGWGEELPARPRAALNTVLSRLRTLLGEGVLWAGPAGYVLDLPRDAVDADRFEALRERAAHAPAEEGAGLLRGALALWRGPAYAEFAERDFASLEAQRLDLLRLETIEAGAALSTETGDVEHAVAGLEALLAEQPFREHAVHLLMTALYRGGRAADALGRYRGYRKLLADELGLDPSPALEDVHSRILGHDVPATQGQRALPGPPAWLDTSTAFVGRESALAELTEAVSDNRLVSITGPGGVGKTRLAAEALPHLSERLATPITIVELAPVRSGAVDAALADALRLSQPTERPREGCLEYLSISEGLLVLDNCEHLLDEVASLVAAIGRRCPRVRVLTTSRRRLGLTSERVLPLEPLPTPGSHMDREQIDTSPAVRMFADRVRRLRPSSGIPGEAPQLVAEICCLLDGLPLALELSASRAAVLGLQPVRDQLVRSLTAEGSGHAEVGYHELWAVVDWSYGLLSAEQQRLFATLSVFAADFDAAAVIGMTKILAQTRDHPYDGRAVIDQLAALADASLLSTRDVGGTVRYRMLTLVRFHAAGQLAGVDEEASVRQAHAQWVRGLVEQAAVDYLGSASAGAFVPLDRYRGDIAAALRWTSEGGQLPLAGDIAGGVELCRQWPADPEISNLVIAIGDSCAALPGPAAALPLAAGACALADRGEVERSRRLGGRALELARTPAEHFLARLALGVAATYAGDHQESLHWWGEISTMEVLPAAYRAEGHISIALLACYHDDLATARQQVTTVLATTALAGPPALQAFARYAEGEVAVKQDLEKGASLLGEAVSEADRAGAAHVSRVARLARLAALVRLGRDDDAVELVGPLLDDERRAGTWPQLWTTMRILAELLASRGLHRDAAFLLAAADCSDSAPPVVGDDVRRYRQLTQELRERLGDGVVDGIGSLASGTVRSQAIDRARVVLDSLRQSGPSSPPCATSPSTARTTPAMPSRPA